MSRAAIGLRLTALLAIVGVAGCAGSTTNPGAQPSGSPSVVASASASAPATPSPTPMPTFVPTGSMNVARWGASAVLLPNGKVLIVGGYSDIGVTVLASAELYDPKTGKFTMTGSMSSARGGPIATLLPDGRVLVAGGADCRDIKTCAAGDLNQLSSAEIYDPKTGKFSRTASMSAGRGGGTAILLHDGRVLLAADSVDTLSAELYDPRSGKFVLTGAVQGGYNSATMTLLPSGKVLLSGDLGGPAAELYDPATGKFAPIKYELPPGAAAAAKRKGYDAVPQTATLLKDGRVLLYGVGYLETYTPETGVFTPRIFATPPGEWYDPTTTLLNDGDVLFAGGSVDTEYPHLWTPAVASAGLFDPVHGFHLIYAMRSARNTQTATLLPDGSALLAGGTSDGETVLASAELFRP